MLARVQHIAVIALCVVAACCLVLITRHAVPVLDSWNGASTLRKANDTLDAISGPRGTLHEVNKAVVKIGDATVTTQLGERKTFPHVIAASDALMETAENGSQSLKAATSTLQTAQTTIQDAQPLLQASTRFVNTGTQSLQDFDRLVREPVWMQLAQNGVKITGSGAHMLDTADQVETKATKGYLHPSKNPLVRTWRAVGPWLQIGAQGVVKWSPVR